MERRKFLIGAGSAAVGSSALIGSGAVSSITADRDANLRIATDENAYLGLQAGDNGYVSQPEGGVIEFNFDDNASATGSGINNRADTVVSQAFTIANQSDRDLYVWVGFAGTDGTAGDPTECGPTSVELLADDSDGNPSDLTFPPSESKSCGEGRALEQTTNTGAVLIPAGEARAVEIRFLVYGSNTARDADFRFVFNARDADDGEPTAKEEWMVDTASGTGSV